MHTLHVFVLNGVINACCFTCRKELACKISPRVLISAVSQCYNNVFIEQKVKETVNNRNSFWSNFQSSLTAHYRRFQCNVHSGHLSTCYVDS